MLNAFQHHVRLWVYKVESEALASRVHGPSEIVHIVLCEFWRGGQGGGAVFGFLKKCVPQGNITLNTVVLLILRTTMGKRYHRRYLCFEVKITCL